jgi:beta-N-acetylhexosaminidase
MIGHLIVSEVSGEPALFSRDLVTGILREELGFRGVVMTDALEMQSVSGAYSESETVVRAVQAGVDMLLCPVDLDGAVNALLSAVEEGTIPEERIDESVLRILAMKETCGLIE